VCLQPPAPSLADRLGITNILVVDNPGEIMLTIV
jgi:hypothetical protein